MDKIFRLQNVEFEWDEEKYMLNLRKHGVKFEEAAEVFFDILAFSGDASVEEERRNYLIGRSFSQRTVFVVFVDRKTRTRIISARKANLKEREEYEETW